LRIYGSSSQGAPGIKSGFKNDFLKHPGINVMGATEGGEPASRLKELQGPEMDLFVAAKRVRDRCPVAGKGGGVQDDHVEFWDQFLVWSCRRVGFQPIEHIGRLERALSVRLFRWAFLEAAETACSL